MGYYFMPVRGEHDPIVNDYVIWSTYVDGPIERGTRGELELWWRSMFGEAGARTLDVETPFTRADAHGSSNSMGDGYWGTTITVMGYGLIGPAQLDRDKLPAFVEAIAPIPRRATAESPPRAAADIGRAVRALVTPLDPSDEPGFDPEAWKAQCAQAVADFEGGSDRNPLG